MFTRLALAIVASLVLGATPAGAEWLPGGVPLCADLCGGDLPILCSDGTGGAFVTWRDARNGNADVYIQHVTASGAIAPGWPPTAIPLCTAPRSQGPTSITRDGQGGAIVVWIDFRNSVATGQDLYAQRITASGALAPGWPINGAPVSRAPGYQYTPTIMSDGQGGAFIAWEDDRANPYAWDIYAQHLTATGTVAEGWPADGLPICTDPEAQGNRSLVADGAGGVLIAWSDNRAGGRSVYGQRITASGAIAEGWIENGLPLVLGKWLASLAPDGGAGAYVACYTPHPYYSGFDAEYYVQCVTLAGAVAPGWPPGGVLVCGALQDRAGLYPVPDGRGGVLLAWYDYRDLSSGGDIYASRVLPDGSIAPGWTTDGLLVSDRPNYESFPSIAPDGSGGAYLTWEMLTGGNRILVQHLTASGAVAPGWYPNGILVGTSQSQFYPRIIADGQGGAIVAWEEYPLGPYAQRFVQDGVVPVLLALVNAEAKTDRVLLTWYGADAAALTATVYRRTPGSEWDPCGTVTADGTGRFRFEDREVTPGERYAYRLGYEEAGSEIFTAETWVEVPALLRLALEGLRPNPAVGALHVWFTLPSAESATLELLDVSGRRVLSREVGSLGAGRHVVRLDDGVAILPGLYWVGLRQGGQAEAARVAVIR